MEVTLKDRNILKEKKDMPSNIFEPTQLPDKDNSAKISLDESGSILDKQSMSDLPNWQMYYKELYEENVKLRSKDEKQVEDLRLLRTQLEMERRNNRELKTEKTNYFAKRSQLEELFLACIDEVRKDISRRKAVTLARKNNLNSQLHANKSSKI